MSVYLSVWLAVHVCTRITNAGDWVDKMREEVKRRKKIMNISKLILKIIE